MSFSPNFVVQAVHRHACICSHTTHAAYRPFAAESLGSGRHGCRLSGLTPGFHTKTTVMPCAHLFISLCLLGPTANADPPTSPQMRPLPSKREAENIHTVSHVLLSQFFSSSIGELSGFNQSDARFIKLDKQFQEHVERSVSDPIQL